MTGVTIERDDEAMARDVPVSQGLAVRLPRVVWSALLDGAAKHGAAMLFDAMHHVLYVLSVWQERFADRQTLAGLDDHLLHDIGLTREDVELRLPKPFWRAPMGVVPGFLTPGAWSC